MDDVYYRVQIDGDRFQVCCLQWFDENDYDASKWVDDGHGTPLRFDTEEDAEEWVRRILTVRALASMRVVECPWEYRSVSIPHAGFGARDAFMLNPIRRGRD